jgi:Leucine Rich repeat
MNLKELNISWCNSISDEGVNAVIKSCLSIEKLILTGLKSLSDAAFEEYAQLKEKFNEKTYDEVRYRIKKAVRERKTKSLA